MECDSSGPSPLQPGTRLGRYELSKPLSQGGMATAWLASTVDGHGAARPIVIKTILDWLSDDDAFRTCFFREGGIASRVSHRNVARVFDLGEDRGVLFIAMEFVDGPSMQHVLSACRSKQMVVPDGIILRVLMDVCAGLQAVHELRDGTGRPLNVVHRDISPSNILISSTGVAKLIDFGVAKVQQSFRPDAVLVGKQSYIPPEQGLGQAVDRRANLWALGAIAYLACSGQKAFDSPNWQARLEWLASGKPPQPLPAFVRPAMAAVVQRALSFAPGDRYATADEMGRALDDAAKSLGVRASHEDVAAFCSAHVATNTMRNSSKATANRADERPSVERALEQAPERTGILSGIRRLFSRP